MVIAPPGNKLAPVLHCWWKKMEGVGGNAVPIFPPTVPTCPYYFIPQNYKDQPETGTLS